MFGSSTDSPFFKRNPIPTHFEPSEHGIRQTMHEPAMAKGAHHNRGGVPSRDVSSNVFDDLTSRQQEILRFIIDYVDKHGSFPPTSEIARGMQLRSPGGVRRILDVLEEKGFIESTVPPGSSRKGRKLTNRVQPLRANCWPLVGIVPAGSLDQAIQTTNHYLSTISDLIPEMSTTDRALRVDGDWMIGQGISPGDYVVIRSTDVFTPKDICAVRLRHGAIALYYIHDTGSGFSLRSANPTYRPLQCERDDVTIIGRVIAHIATTQFRS